MGSHSSSARQTDKHVAQQLAFVRALDPTLFLPEETLAPLQRDTDEFRAKIMYEDLSANTVEGICDRTKSHEAERVRAREGLQQQRHVAQLRGLACRVEGCELRLAKERLLMELVLPTPRVSPLLSRGPDSSQEEGGGAGASKSVTRIRVTPPGGGCGAGRYQT